MILEITEYGAYISRNHDSFVVKIRDRKKEFPAKKIDAINITANSVISTSAIRLCLENNIQLVISNISGFPEGRFWFSTSGKNSELRRRQYLAKDNKIGLNLTRYIIKEKIIEQRKLLYDLWRNRKNDRSLLKDAIKKLDYYIEHLDEDGKKMDKPSLLGIEGDAAKHYFEAISYILLDKYKFKRRSRKPAEDQFNAILNYSYGICYKEVESAIIISGLDPNAGICHQDQYGKPTLSYDVIELFRSRVDRLVLYLFAKKKVNDKWFESVEDGYFLNRIGRQIIIKEYYSRLNKNIKNDAYQFCRQIIKNLME